MGGTVSLEVTNKRRWSNFPEGGMEGPCILTLVHNDQKIIEKADESLLTKKDYNKKILYNKLIQRNGKRTQSSNVVVTYCTVMSLFTFP